MHENEHYFNENNITVEHKNDDIIEKINIIQDSKDTKITYL